MLLSLLFLAGAGVAAAVSAYWGIKVRLSVERKKDKERKLAGKLNVAQ